MKADLSKFTPDARAAFERVDWQSPRGAAHIVGFNYQPSWAGTGAKCWIDGFDAAKYRAELENGKKHFPLMNTVRIWLHYGAWMKDAKTVETNVKTAFSICRDLDLLVMPVLTSKWGDEPWGLPRAKDPAALKGMDEYFLAMDAASDGGGNILVWDLCNEPPPMGDPKWDAWLRDRSAFVRARFSANRTTIGTTGGTGAKPLGLLDAVDLWSFHPYPPFTHDAANPAKAAEWRATLPELGGKFHATIRQWMSRYGALPHGRKPAIASECCWGSMDDGARATVVEESLRAFVDAGIGFLPHALQESEVYDLHRPEHGSIPVGRPGFMAFVLMDGSLRPGHDIFNKYAEMALNPKAKPVRSEERKPGKPARGTGSPPEAKPAFEVE